MGGGSKRMQRRQSPIIVRTGRVELAMLRREPMIEIRRLRLMATHLRVAQPHR
jgi:hypothetical protein